jgi:hypothetical protein
MNKRVVHMVGIRSVKTEFYMVSLGKLLQSFTDCSSRLEVVASVELLNQFLKRTYNLHVTVFHVVLQVERLMLFFFL